MVARDSVTDMAMEVPTIERVFDAPIDRVFDAFTRGEHLQKWWGPTMASITSAKFDARPGGKIFVAERYPDGTMIYSAGVVREIERPSRLVFAIHFADADGRRVAPPTISSLGDNWDDEIVSIVTFGAEGRGTRVTIRTQKSGVTADWLAKARIGWGQAFDKLAEALAEALPPRPVE